MLRTLLYTVSLLKKLDSPSSCHQQHTFTHTVKNCTEQDVDKQVTLQMQIGIYKNHQH